MLQGRFGDEGLKFRYHIHPATIQEVEKKEIFVLKNNNPLLILTLTMDYDILPGQYPGQNLLNDLFVFNKDRFLLNRLPRGEILYKIFL